MKKDIFVFIEIKDNEIQKVSLELLSIARELSLKEMGRVVVGVVGENLKNLTEQLKYYDIDLIYQVENVKFKFYLNEYYADAVETMILKADPNIVLIGATVIGRDLAPRLSARFKTGLTADCTHLEIDEMGNLLMTRPAFSGNLLATIVCLDHRPQMSTVRPGVMSLMKKGAYKDIEVINLELKLKDSKVEIIEEIIEKHEQTKIEEAHLLVGLGRGLGNKELLNVGMDIAELLKGTYACSRALVDCGLIEVSRQVGQTGKTVKPTLYLAIGISGAIQHLSGMENSEYIIAINSDKTAPIFKICDLGIVGDVKQIVPLLKDEILKQIERE